jgi:hypothetical protein
MERDENGIKNTHSRDHTKMVRELKESLCVMSLLI